ncbi:anti-sigma factor family protein [Yoonia sp.]|uniref:anti-sigma factor family protein n=1 Tax=Yoonia sp. TaxID=2212373 RepID=UPI003A4DA5B3
MTQSNEVSDDMLMALADGELNEIDAQCLHRVIAADPGLAARYADFVSTRQLLQDAYLTEPASDRLVTAVMQGTNVVHLHRPMAQKAGLALGLAASLVLALGGFWAGRSTGPQPVGQTDLAQVTADLITGEDTEMPDGSMVRVLASYDTAQGLCRLIDQGDQRHVLCRDLQAGAWVTALSVTDGHGDSFLPASDLGVRLIDSLLDELGAGPALDADAERSALSR